ncbi:MAG: phage protein Gp37 [Thermodesulfobacteriota bacterium]
MHELEALEDAILTALSGLTGVRTLEAYAGQIDDADDLARLTARFPCVYVLADGLASEVNNRVDMLALSVSLLVGDKHARGASGASRGDAHSPGIYAILEEIKTKLHRQSVTVNGRAVPLARKSEEALAVSATGISLYLARYEAEMKVPFNP